MEFAYDLSGTSTAIIKKYQVAATNTVLGRPYLVAAADGGGIVLATTTGAVDAIGVNIDAAGSYVTAQQTDNATTERLTSIIINPNAVYKAKLSGGSAANTALGLFTATSGGSDGLTVVMDTSVASPDMNEGTIFGYSGTNIGQKRKVGSTSSLTATVLNAFNFDAVSGDTFLLIGMTPAQTETLTLTTNCDQIDASLAPTGATIHVIETLMLDASADGRNNSYAYIMLEDHHFSGALT